ncbi:hypothetical protein B5X24_HaOG216422 [Helicoverpa armigera]|nr:hypothetical protein B5X24_HaOG216422 [Helicoverpa armigera]
MQKSKCPKSPKFSRSLRSRLLFLTHFFFTFSYFNIPIFARFACGFFALRIFLLYKFRCFSDPKLKNFRARGDFSLQLFVFFNIFCLTYQEGNS